MLWKLLTCLRRRRCPVCGNWFRSSGPIGFLHRGRELPVCRAAECQEFARRRAEQDEQPRPSAGELIALDVLRAELAGVEVEPVRFTSEGGLAALEGVRVGAHGR